MGHDHAEGPLTLQRDLLRRFLVPASWDAIIGVNESAWWARFVVVCEESGLVWWDAVAFVWRLTQDGERAVYAEAVEA